MHNRGNNPFTLSRQRQTHSKAITQSNVSVTLTAMKIVGITIIVADLILLLVWFGGAIYVVYNLATHICFFEMFYAQFFILIHFALGMCICNIVQEIINKQHERRLEQEKIHTTTNSTRLIQEIEDRPLSYDFYLPLPWVFTSLISLFGDIILLSYAIRIYQISLNEECHNAELAHIIYDAIAVFISVFSVLWFIVFSFYAIRHKNEV